MKSLKKILAAIACAALVLAGVVIVPNTAKAAGPKTYTVHWDGSGWYYQTSIDSTWLGISSLDSGFNAGDSIVVDGQGQAGLTTCNITVTKATGDLCAAGGATAIINVSGGNANRAYATYGGTLIVNGNVNTALVSANGIVQVNGDVDVLEGDYSYGKVFYGVTGSVNTAHVKINSDTQDYYYSIPAGKMKLDANGIVWLNDGEFSRTPGAKAPGTGNAGGLDDVPKTGSFALEYSIIVIAAAIILGATSVVLLRRKEQ